MSLEHLDGDQVTNGAAYAIGATLPYMVTAECTGIAPFLFHRWNVESVASKAKAAKGSKAKKEDDIESYVYRDEKGRLAIPGEYFRQSIIHAAKFSQDPRSPRKSAMDLFRAGVTTLSPLCTLGTDKWNFIDRRRVLVQRNGITRARPAMSEGWKISVDFLVLLPEYISSEFLNDRLQAAGRLVGVGDNRPTYGRFQVTSFQLRKEGA